MKGEIFPACLCCNPPPPVSDMDDDERNFMAGAAFVTILGLRREGALCSRHAPMLASVISGVREAHLTFVSVGSGEPPS